MTPEARAARAARNRRRIARLTLRIARGRRGSAEVAAWVGERDALKTENETLAAMAERKQA